MVRRLAGCCCGVAGLALVGSAHAQAPAPSDTLPWVAPAQPPVQPQTQPPVPLPPPPQPPPAQAQPVPQPAPSPYYWPAPNQYYRPIGPAELPYQEGLEPPPGYELQSRRSIPLIVAGSVTLGVAWYVAFIAGYLGMVIESIDSGHEDHATNWGMVMVPAIGPFLGAMTVDTTATVRTALVMDGLAQVGGIVMLTMGIKTVTRKWVRVDNAKVDWRVSPIRAGSSGMGLGVVGSF